MLPKRIEILVNAILILLNLHSIASLTWEDEYTLKDLQSNGADLFPDEASSWIISSCFSANQCDKYYNCSGTYILGGYKVLGGTSGQSYQRTYTELPNHNQINIQVTIYPLDSWDVLLKNDRFEFQFDGITYTGWALDSVTFGKDFVTNLCGNTLYKDLPPVNAIITLPHNASTLVFKVVSRLDEDSENESVGLRDITMNFVNVSTPSYSLCGGVTVGTLPDKICTCTGNTYMSPPNSGNCPICDSLCTTCIDSSSKCTSCYNGTYLGSNTCKPCHSSCATCDGPSASNCLSCPPETYLVDQTCTPYCPEPFYSTQISGTNVCQTNCPGEFAYKNGSCSPECESPYGPFYTVSLKACICYNPGQDVCYACDPSCATCLGQEATQCATCNSRKYVSVIDTTNSTGTCEACDPSCLTCNGPAAYECLTCDPYYFLVTDNNSTNGTCQSCDETCVTCNGPLSNQCLTCTEDFYFDGTSAGGTCSPCDPSCATCDGPSAQQCLTCDTGSYLVNNNTCVTTCPSPFFVTTNGRKDFCDTPCPDSWNSSAFRAGVFHSEYCQPNCGNSNYSTYRAASVATLNACYCDGYEYWNTSCVSTCDFPLTIKTEDNRKYCNFSCEPNQFLYWNGSCSDYCDFPLIWENRTSNKFCFSKGCTAMEIKYLKTITQGFEYRLEFKPESCDWEAQHIQELLSINEVAKETLRNPVFTVTKISAGVFLVDLTLSQSVLDDTSLHLDFGTISADMLVFQKFKNSELAEQLKALAQSVQTAVTSATGATLVSTLIMQGTASVWGFVGFQQLLNFLKYINIQYPAQMEMLFVLGGGTKFDSILPNVFETVTQSEYDQYAANEDLVETQTPPRKFSDYEETSVYIKNGGSLILLNLVIIIITTLIAIIRRIKKIRENKIFVLIDTNLRWNFALRTYLTTSLPLGVAICLQMRTITFTDGEYLMISGILAVASGAYFVSMCLIMLRILYKLQPEDFKKKECLDVYGTLVKGQDVKTQLEKYYYMLVFARGVIIAVLIVFVQTLPYLQIGLLIGTNVVLVTYIFWKITFLNAKEKRKTLITEFLITVTEVLITLLAIKKKSEQYYDIIGWVIVGLVAVMFINELIFIITVQIATVKEVIKTIKEKLKKKSKLEVRQKTNEAFEGLALPTSPVESPKATENESLLSLENPDLFSELDQASPTNMIRITSSKNLSPMARITSASNLSPLSFGKRQCNTATSLLLNPRPTSSRIILSPHIGDKPLVIDSANSTVVEGPVEVATDLEILTSILATRNGPTTSESNEKSISHKE